MAGIVVSNKVRRLVGNRLKEIDVPTTSLNTSLFYADLASQGASYTQSRVNAELNAYPTTVKNNASLALTPNANKEGVVYAMNGDTKTLEEFEFQRGSSATYFDASGVMQLAALNVPRINFENGASKGLLIEPSSMNLITDSGILNGLASIPSKSTVGLTAVDTNFNKGTLLSQGVRMELNSTEVVYAYKQFTTNIDTIYTFSIFVKMDDGSVPTSNDIKVFTQGSIISNFSVINCGNNVYRIVFSFVGIKNGTERVGLVKYTDSSNKSLTITGFQVEQSGQVSSYIPTTSAIGTRLADKVLSKRPLAVFNNNSFFVKTAEWPAEWMGSGVDNLVINGKNLVKSSNFGGVFSAYNQSVITKTVNIPVPEWGATDANHIISSGGANLIKAISHLGTPKADELITVSFWIKNIHSNNVLTLGSNAGGRTTIILPNQAAFVSWEGILGNGNGALQIQIRSEDVEKDVSIIVWRVKNEKGASATSWRPAPEDYIKVDSNGNIEISYNEPIHIQQFSLISRELKQEEV